jgi:hypothetical protein
MKKIFFLLLVVSHAAAYGQVVGGEHSYEFLRLSNSPHVTALGGVSVSSPSKDMMMGFANPALLRPEFHTTIGMNHNFYYGGTRVSNVLYTQFNQKLNTTFGVGMTYLNYGSFTQTDNLGNSNGTFRAVDYALHVMASKHYLEKWRYGIDLKYASSNLASQRSSALLADVGVMFADTASQWYFGAVVKNAGITIKNYDPSIPQSVPVDLQIGFTKKFKKAPFSIMVLAHHLTKWDIRYDNPADRIDNQLLFENTTAVKEKSYFADKLFRHFVFALDINLGKRLEISAGYNHLRRSELSIVDKKGMSGFSFGAGMYLNKFTVHYAQSIYHVAGPYHELGLNIRLNDLFGMGNMGNKINWSEKFARSY